MNIVRATSPRSDEDGLRVLRELAQDATGILRGPQKDAMVPGRLGSRFQAPGLHAVGDYVRFLHKGPFQASSCRSVMIHFDEPTRDRLTARFREELAPGLFVGLSASLTGLELDLEARSPGVDGR